MTALNMRDDPITLSVTVEGPTFLFLGIDNVSTSLGSNRTVEPVKSALGDPTVSPLDLAVQVALASVAAEAMSNSQIDGLNISGSSCEVCTTVSRALVDLSAIFSGGNLLEVLCPSGTCRDKAAMLEVLRGLEERTAYGYRLSDASFEEAIGRVADQLAGVDLPTGEEHKELLEAVAAILANSTERFQPSTRKLEYSSPSFLIGRLFPTLVGCQKRRGQGRLFG